jgi:hypothetical protein
MALNMTAKLVLADADVVKLFGVKLCFLKGSLGEK